MMVPNELTIVVKLDFLQLEKIIAEYVSEKPDDDGEEVYASYREQAKDQMEDFLAWLKRRKMVFEEDANAG